MPILIARVLFYGSVFAISFMTGRILGRMLNEQERKHRIKQYHSMNAVRKNCGLSKVPPSHFSLWPHDVGE